MKITVSKLFAFEQFLTKYVNTPKRGQDIVVDVSDGGLSWGYGRNAIKIQRLLPEIREELSLIKPAAEYQEKIATYEKERTAWLIENVVKPEEEKIDYINALMDKHGVREELERLAKMTNDFMNEVRDVPLYRISKNSVGGLRPGDDPAKCPLTARDIAFLIDLGVLYDPDDDEAEEA